MSARCKFCKGEIIQKSWIQPLPGGLCPVGEHLYCECSTCGMRYSPQEVEMLTKELADLSDGEKQKVLRCRYRPDLEILCLEEECGKGNACDCEIFMRYSGLLAQALSERD